MRCIKPNTAELPTAQMSARGTDVPAPAVSSAARSEVRQMCAHALGLKIWEQKLHDLWLRVLLYKQFAALSMQAWQALRPVYAC